MSAVFDDDASFFGRDPEDCWHEKDGVVEAELSIEPFHDERLVFMVQENFPLWGPGGTDRVACVSLNREQVVSVAERLLEVAKEMKVEIEDE